NGISVMDSNSFSFHSREAEMKRELPKVRRVSLNETRTAWTPDTEARISEEVQRLVATLEAELAGVIVGQLAVVRGVITALLAGGHVLLEGVPGLGKTLLVRTLAECVDLTYSRIQFTPDLMPADIVGTDVITET